MTDEDAAEEEAPKVITDEEALLFLRAGQGDEGMTALRERHHSRLVSYAFKTIRDYNYRGPKNADEIVNDVWSAFWEKLPGRQVKNVAGYLIRMVRYQVLQALSEDIKTRERHMKDTPDIPDQTERTKIPSAEVDRLEELLSPLVIKNELLIAVSTLELLGRLSERKAQAVVLRYIHGFSAAEVAQHMNIKVNNASSTISQGAKIVSDYLERRGRVD